MDSRRTPFLICESVTGTKPPPVHRVSEEERRRQILRATIHVVAQHGFEAANTSLQQAGVSKELIWH
jgi:AcrR family transcriptional regulator